jgi:hypothetical protein
MNHPELRQNGSPSGHRAAWLWDLDVLKEVRSQSPFSYMYRRTGIRQRHMKELSKEGAHTRDINSSNFTIREMELKNHSSDKTGAFLREDGRTRHGYAVRPRTDGRQGQSGPSDLCTYSSPHGMDTVQYPPSMTKEQDQPPSSRGYVPAWAPHGTRTDKTLPQDWVTPWEMPPP